METVSYLIIETCGSNDAPIYNGVCHVTKCATIDEVKKTMEKIAGVYGAYIGRTVNKGDCLDEDYKPIGRIKYADVYYSEDGLRLWVRGMQENWERAEVFEVKGSEIKNLDHL